MEEIWKDVEGYDGHYKVSNQGNVKTMHYKNKYSTKEKVLTTMPQQGGYLKVALCRNGKRKFEMIHRLVAKAFIPNPYNKPQVNHKNGIKTDNREENLEWCTNGENGLHAIKMGLKVMPKGEKCKVYGMYGSDSYKAVKILQYTMQGGFIKEWGSIIEASRELGIDSSAISKCCRKKLKTTGGYVWRYKEE